MSSGPSLKACLRSARDALSSGDFRTTVKWCKSALKVDKNCYEAYLYVGKASFREKLYDNAAAAYSKAIQISEKNAAAWQGLAELHGPAGTQDSLKQIEAYEQLIKISIESEDMAKVLEYRKRRAAALSSSGSHSQAKEAWLQILQQGDSMADRIPTESHYEAIMGVAESAMAEYEALKLSAAGKKRGKGSKAMADMAERLDAVSRIEKLLEGFLHSAVEIPVHYASVARRISFENSILSILMGRIVSAESTREQSAACSALFSHFISPEQSRRPHSVKFYLSAMAFSQFDCFEGLSDAWARVQPHKFASVPPREAWILHWGSRLGHMHPGHGLSLLAAAMAGKKSAAARKTVLQKSVALYPKFATSWLCLSRACFESDDTKGALDSVARGADVLKSQKTAANLSTDVLQAKFNLLEAEIWLRLGNVASARDKFAAVLEVASESDLLLRSESLKGLVQAAIQCSEWTEVRARLSQLLQVDPGNGWALGERGWLAYRQGEAIESAMADLKAAIQICPGDSLHYLRLGRLCWEAGGALRSDRKNGASFFLLQAAKLDPQSFEAFQLLGHCYRLEANDATRAIRCYQRAIDINPEDNESGEPLCQLLRESGQLSLIASLATRATSQSVRAFWAWKVLGLTRVSDGNFAEGVSALQNALRGQPKDGHSWEAIALAYQRLGRLSSALKAYDKAMATLSDPDSTFSKIQSATIHLQLGDYPRAIGYFDRLAGDEGTWRHPTVLWGKACALLGRSREVNCLGAVQWAVDLLKEAESLAELCVEVRQNVQTWKLLGDIQFEMSQIVPSTVDKQLNATRACDSYSSALQMDPDNASLCRDLAQAQNRVRQLADTHSTATDAPDHDVAADVASGLALKALKLDGGNSASWLTCGSVLRHPGLVQHTLIRALQIDPNNGPAWAALGQFYLSHDVDLAREAFTKCRSVDPLSSVAWWGTGLTNLILSQGREEVLEESLRDTLHSQQLQATPANQFLLTWISVRLNRHSSHSVLASIQQCNLTFDRRNEETELLLGLTAAACGLHEMAVSSFEHALILLRESSARDEEETSQRAAIVRYNLALSSLKVGKMGTCVAQLQHLKERSLLDAGGLSLYAMALWKSGRESEAMAAAKQSLVSGDSSALKVHISILAATNHLPEAMDCFQKAPQHLRRDAGLVSALLAASICARSPRHLAWITACCRRVFNERKTDGRLYALLADSVRVMPDSCRGLSVLKSAVHMFPDSLSMRCELSGALLSQGQTRTAVRCVKYSSRSGRVFEKAVPRLVRQLALCTLSCDSCCSDTTARQQIIRLQKCIRVDPTEASLRLLLIACLLQEAQRTDQSHKFKSLAALCSSQLAEPRRVAMAEFQDCYLHIVASQSFLRQRTAAMAARSLLHASSALQLAGNIQNVDLISLSRCQQLKCQLANGQASSLARQPADNFSLLGAVAHAQAMKWQRRYRESLEVLQMAESWIVGNQKGALMWQPWLQSVRLMMSACWKLLGNIQLAVECAASAVQVAEETHREVPAVASAVHGCLCVDQLRRGVSKNLLSGRRSLARAIEGGDFRGARLLLAEVEQSLSRNGNKDAKCAALVEEEFLAWTRGVKPDVLLWKYSFVIGSKVGEGMDVGRVSRMLRQKALHFDPSVDRYWKLVQYGV